MRKETNPLKRLASAMIILVLAASGCGDDAAIDGDEPVDPAPAVAMDGDESSVDEGEEAQPLPVPEPSTSEDETSSTNQAAPTTEAPAELDDTTPEEPITEPIRLGAVSTLTGPASFPESHLAAQAVFDRVNAAGGIGGRMIEYIVEDDGFDPGLASQAARRLADEEGVVALVGSASILECAVNAGFYAENGLFSIQGTGIDPVCFATSNISPVNTGPFFSDAVALYYASEELAAENVCFGAFDVPDFQPAYAAAIAEWTAATGKELAYSDTTLIFDGDLTPFMLELESNGCDAAVVQANDFHYVAMMQIREAQGLDVQVIGLTSGYTEAVAEQLGPTGNGLVLASEFEPFTDLDSEVLADWRTLMNEAGVPLTSFAEGGYLAATIMVGVLEGIEGEITRESVAAALLGFEPVDTGLTGTPYAFGEGDAHGSNRAAKFVELVDGEWVVKTPEWIVVP
ncbi:MAG: ABC transporter substrate-binding protein [Acidimicrobiaceae bacterium]|nr:ABC transporter substrate-binding protein [Acidimicrobiaceae bacterium]MDE0493341.1 ABC transporter substrate-binding protein [Acidimicrobiaceae bacterium]